MAAFAVSAVLLLSIMGLAIDAGRLYVSKTELQNAADSCALAAAAALTGANADQLTQAENWGIAAGRQNLVGMQNGAPTISADQAVTFSNALNGAFRTKADIGTGGALAMRFARCTIQETSIAPILVGIANLLEGQTIGDTTIGATAVATLAPSISNCALPIAMCKEEVLDLNRQPGDWLCGKFEPGNQANQTKCPPSTNLTGAYKWVRFPGFSQIKDLRDLIGGVGQCNLSGTSTVQGHNGQISSLIDPWNSRFGLYKGAPDLAGSPPDLTGRTYSADPTSPAYWVDASSGTPRNAFPDFQGQRAANAVGNVPAKGAYNWISSDQHRTAGGDRRMAVTPIVDCTALGATSGSIPIIDWACVMMLNPVFNPNDEMYLEYRGRASNLAEFAAAGCVSSGLPGGPTAGGPRVPTLVQ
jgi:Flp pilus assembly protein TadG